MNHGDFFKQFCGEHGRYVTLPRSDGRGKSNHLLFSDGALLENSGTGVGMTREPPEDQLERAGLIKQFWQISLDQAAQEFNDYRSELEDELRSAERHGNAAMLPDEDEAIDKLKRLKGRVARVQAKLGAAQRELDAVTPAWVASREADKGHARSKASSFRNSISSIEI